MRMHRLVVATAGALLAGTAFCQVAQAHLLIDVNKSDQRMLVAQDGRLLYDWPVSTGGNGYSTPSGSFQPFRMDINHRSQEYDNAPMPYSIFFTRTGIAVHGTNEQATLGEAVSHGCVRLSVAHAAKLWNLVKQETMANTTVVVTSSPRSARPAIVADAGPVTGSADQQVQASRSIRIQPEQPIAVDPGSSWAASAPNPPPAAQSAPPMVADSAPMVLVPPADVGAPPIPPAADQGNRPRGLLSSLFGQ